MQGRAGADGTRSAPFPRRELLPGCAFVRGDGRSPNDARRDAHTRCSAPLLAAPLPSPRGRCAPLCPTVRVGGAAAAAELPTFRETDVWAELRVGGGGGNPAAASQRNILIKYFSSSKYAGIGSTLRGLHFNFFFPLYTKIFIKPLFYGFNKQNPLPHGSFCWPVYKREQNGYSGERFRFLLCVVCTKSSVIVLKRTICSRNNGIKLSLNTHCKNIKLFYYSSAVRWGTEK